MRTVVYRVEDSKGSGPYMSHYNLMEMSIKHSDSKHPEPFDDDMDSTENFTADYVCGFSSVSKAKQWFKGFRRLLDKKGFKLSVYEVPEEHVMRGRRQVVFKKDGAKLLKTKGLVLIK